MNLVELLNVSMGRRTFVEKTTNVVIVVGKVSALGVAGTIFEGLPPSCGSVLPTSLPSTTEDNLVADDSSGHPIAEADIRQQTGASGQTIETVTIYEDDPDTGARIPLVIDQEKFTVGSSPKIKKIPIGISVDNLHGPPSNCSLEFDIDEGSGNVTIEKNTCQNP